MFQTLMISLKKIWNMLGNLILSEVDLYVVFQLTVEPRYYTLYLLLIISFLS